MESGRFAEEYFIHQSRTSVRLLIRSNDTELVKVVISAIASGRGFHKTDGPPEFNGSGVDMVIDDCRFSFPTVLANEQDSYPGYRIKFALIRITQSTRISTFDLGYADFIGWPVVRAEVHARMDTLCELYLKNRGSVAHSTDPLVDACCKYLLENLSKAVSVSMLSRRFATNHNTLNQRFNSQFNQPPMKWLRARRLEEAAAILSRTVLPMSAVAAEVGYEQPENFSTAFKRRFGVTPSQFRKMKKSKEILMRAQDN